MADFPALGRQEIINGLAQYQIQKDANIAQIAVLEAENDRIDVQLTIGQDTLDFIETETDLPDVTGFVISSPNTGEAEMTWDNMGTGVTYRIQKASSADFDEPTEMYNGAYTSAYTDSLAGSPGDVVYYRIMSMKFGKDDSAWVEDSVIIS